MSSQQSRSNASVQSSFSVSSRYSVGTLEGSNPLWAYVSVIQTKKDGGGDAIWRCNYCGKPYEGSYFKLKSHLLMEIGNGIDICYQVSNECFEEMKQIEWEANERKKLVQGSKKRRGMGGALEKQFNNEEAKDHLTCEIARWFYSAGIPFNVARNPYFISALSYATKTSIPDFIPPSSNDIRTTLMEREKARILKLLQLWKNFWPEIGVSIVIDRWADSERRPLINFIAVSASRPMFLKATDGSGEYEDKHSMANLILTTIDEVGPQNVVQIIANNASVSEASRSIVEGIHPHIFWTPCVVHTLDFALKNICAPKNAPTNEIVYNECNWISKVADDVHLIRNFIMNHSMRPAMFNQFVHLKLLAVADTRFASTIVMFKRLKVIKHGFQSMVISEEWSHYKEDDLLRAAYLKETILKDIWWDKVDYVLSFTKPIYDMLRACDTDESTLHLVYEKWYSMIEHVKLAIYQHESKELDQHSSFYEVVYNILNDGWTKNYTPLYCLVRSLNPRYYCRQWLDEAPNRVPPHKDNEICMGRNKCLRSYFPDEKERLEATSEFVKFLNGGKELDQFDCLPDRWNLEPKVWWVMYGTLFPKLRNIALKLFSQPSSSSCCGRNWSTYSFIHSERNKLNSKRYEDLVFIHTNLRLMSRKSKSYEEGESKMWDIGGDDWDSLEGAGILEVASLSLDEPDLEALLFTDDGQGNDEIDTARV